MKSFMEALNRPAEAFQKGNKAVSWVLVAFTIFINSVFEPVLQHFWGVGTPELNALKMLKITGLGVLFYLLICFVFWVVCKCFGSKTALADHIGAWGISYFPTLVCSIVVAVTEVFFFVFWNSTVWGMILSFIFVGVLIWKAILSIVYLREFVGLKGIRFFGAFAIIGIIILLLALLNGYVGLKTPIL